MTSNHSRRAITRSLSALGALFITGAVLVAMPANAAPQAAGITLDVTSGTVADFDAGSKVTFHTDLACGAGNDMAVFLVEPGKEIIPVAADGSSELYTDYGFARQSVNNVDPETGMISGVQDSDGNGQFGPTLIDPSNFSMVALGSTMQASHAYSLGLVCMVGRDGGSQVLGDASGQSIATWVTIQRDAGNGWSQVIPKADTSLSLAGVQQGSNDAALTATVTPADAAGTVDFTEGTTVHSAPVVSGQATVTIPGLSDGSHTFVAQFMPAEGSNYNGSTSSAIAVTIAKVKLATTVALVGTATGYDTADYVATITAAGATAVSATGSVEFWSNGEKKQTQAVANGVAGYSVSDLEPGSSVSYTAKYVPAEGETGYSASPETSAVTVALPALPELLTDGMVAAPGTEYRVDYAADTFVAGETVTGEIHSDPIGLDETATVAADGSVRYIFVMPAGVKAGSHELVLSDGESTETVAFSVAEAAIPSPGATNAPSAPAGSNPAALFHTDWLATTGSPAGVLAVIGSLLALAAAAVGGWFVWRRRAAKA